MGLIIFKENLELIKYIWLLETIINQNGYIIVSSNQIYFMSSLETIINQNGYIMSHNFSISHI